MKIKKITILTIALALVVSITGCSSNQSQTNEDSNINTDTITIGNASEVYPEANIIILNGSEATLNGSNIEEYDYTWHIDPTTVHTDVKNSPAEYYTGTKPDTDAAAYIDHELYYYPSLDVSKFTLTNYDGEREWVYYYQDGENNDYIFSTLPSTNGNSVPEDMMHTEEEASENKVLHITKAGQYIIEGQWNGQIWIDLGDSDSTFTDSDAKVTLIFNGVEINCSVAPGVVFYSLYECDNTWEDQTTYSAIVDTTDAGANVIVADGSVNKVTGTNVYRILKTKYKTNSTTVQKKAYKIDAAFYSYVSMNITGGSTGDGILEINSGFEGLDSELHLTINGGNIYINSEDDGINVNEDNVSVFTLNAGYVKITGSASKEGDGIDSNGYVMINGGTLEVENVTIPDTPIDTDCGATYNGGTIISSGTTLSLTPGTTYKEIGGGMGSNNPGKPGNNNGWPNNPGGQGGNGDWPGNPGGQGGNGDWASNPGGQGGNGDWPSIPGGQGENGDLVTGATEDNNGGQNNPGSSGV